MPKPMKVWIAEDDDNDANKAYQLITRIRSQNLRVFRDRRIYWGADLTELPDRPDKTQLCGLEHMPDIVILDLFDEDHRFAAAKFYNQLRAEETASERAAAFVVVWSVKTGLDEVQSFLKRKPLLDRRLTFTNSKSEAALETSLTLALRSWKEASRL